jgi:hypothetical protein
MSHSWDGHTPGPWKVLDATFDDKNKFPMYRISMDGGEGVIGAANARLIEAAPDLAERVDALEAENKRLREALGKSLKGNRDLCAGCYMAYTDGKCDHFEDCPVKEGINAAEYALKERP